MSTTSHDLSSGGQLLAGETVDVYLARAIGQTVITFETLDSLGEVTITGLDYDTEYAVVGRTSARTIRFRTRPALSMEERLGRTSHVIDAYTDFGVRADNGETDNGPLLNAALAALSTWGTPGGPYGGTLLLPPGIIEVRETLEVPTDCHVRILGQGYGHVASGGHGTQIKRRTGMTTELIYAVGAYDPTFDINGRPKLHLEQMGLHGNNITSPIVRIARANECSIDHVRIGSCNAEGLVLTQMWNAFFNNVRISSCGNGITNPAVRIDAPTGEEASNGLHWTNCKWEGNNGIDVRITGSDDWAIVNTWVNCQFERAGVATWPLIELLRAAANHFIGCWFHKGTKTTDLRATGPLIKQTGPSPTDAGIKRANIFSGSTFSYWGDTDQYIDHADGALVVDGCSFNSEPAIAYIDVGTGVDPDESVIGTNYYEIPAKTVRDQRTTRRTNTDNGRLGAFAPSATGWTGAVGAVSANNGRISRFVPERNMRVKGIGFHVSTAAGANDNFDVGIYDSALAKIVSSGATAGKLNSTGKKRIDITETTLIAGQVYYIAGSCGALGGTAAQITQASFSQPYVAAFFGTTAGLVEADSAAAIHPLGATITPAGGASSGFLFFLHEDAP